MVLVIAYKRSNPANVSSSCSTNIYYTNILMPYGFAALRMLTSDFILPKRN